MAIRKARHAFIALAYGSISAKFADLAAYFPEASARDCAHEYFALANAFQKDVSPRIDFELAKAILEANWLPRVTPKPGTERSMGANE